jgi:hypothetical protein
MEELLNLTLVFWVVLSFFGVVVVVLRTVTDETDSRDILWIMLYIIYTMAVFT